MGHETRRAAMRSKADIRKRLEYLEGYLKGAQDRLNAGLDTMESPYIPASQYQDLDNYTDEL
jgi:hypothetical protein